ncbi:MAG: DeoR/GlpR family DNA-binding transcription regulator [Clostridiales bacterium]|nr:DeoR/GlpR family DNA-binding transcription regulator [Clostridiales bacterium]
MSPKEREKQIKELLEREEKITVAEISELCSVTEETVRKDFNKLEEDGVLIRVHGGAVSNKKKAENSNQHFFQRRMAHADEKKKIAALARHLITGRTTVFADSSSTVVEALLQLPEDTELTVVTNSTELFLESKQPGIHIISTGGDFNRKSMSLQGKLAKKAIAHYNVDLALIGCKALDQQRGVQDSNENEAEIKEMMIEQAQEVALLMDHFKFDRTAFVRLLSVEKLDYLVTDCFPGEEWAACCQEHDIELICE